MNGFLKAILVFFTLLLFTSQAFAVGFLPRDKANNLIQGTAPDVFTSKTITGSGSNTLDVRTDMTVRFKCDKPITYHFGTGVVWPVQANEVEYILVPQGASTLSLFSTYNPTVCNIQESRR